MTGLRVGVFGAGGRMGAAVCNAVLADPDLELVAAVDPSHSGIDLREVVRLDVPPMTVSSSAAALSDAGADVAVDFTHIDAARQNLEWCATGGIHAVAGTTGFTDDDHGRLRSLFTDSNCVIAPNFAIGAVLMMRFAEQAAPYFDSVEIIEIHHDQKLDAPSGTAILTAERIAAASSEWADDSTTTDVLAGARGARGPGGVTIHSVRLRGLVAHQEVLFGTTGQSLTIRHDSYDRTSFMPGVLLAIKAVPDCSGLTIGLDSLLEL